MIKRMVGENTPSDTRAFANESAPRRERYVQVLECLKERPMTAKEVAMRMHEKGYIPTDERNFAAPRMTELMNMGVIEPLGKKKCSFGRRMVTVYGIIENNMVFA